MNVNSVSDPIGRPDELSRTWPFLDEDEIRDIGGRVDRLYRTLLAHDVSRGDAARQIHRFVRRETPASKPAV